MSSVAANNMIGNSRVIRECITSRPEVLVPGSAGGLIQFVNICIISSTLAACNRVDSKVVDIKHYRQMQQGSIAAKQSQAFFLSKIDDARGRDWECCRIGGVAGGIVVW